MNISRSKSGLVSTLGTGSLVCLLALGAAAVVNGCSSEPLSGEGVENTGSLGLALQVGPGVTVNAVTYSITGNGFSKTGSIDVSGASTISGTIGGIPAGNGYTLTLTATSADGGTTFTGSATFNVTAGKTTAVTIRLKGTATTGNGSVTVNGTLNVAPVIDELTVTPLNLNVGSSVTLNGVAKDADSAPSPLSYYWSTTGGVIDNPVGPNAKLTSTTPGTFTVKLTVSDGDLTTSGSTTVTFVDPAAGGGGAGGGGGQGPAQPNVLLVIADDYGAEAASLYPSLTVRAARCRCRISSRWRRTVSCSTTLGPARPAR